MEDAAVDFLLESLNQLVDSNYSWISNNLLVVANRDQIRSFRNELQYLRNFLADAEDKQYEHQELEVLVKRIGDLAYQANDALDSFIASIVNQVKEAAQHPLWLDSTVKEIEFIKAEVMQIYARKIIGIGALPYGNSSNISPTRVDNMPVSVLTEDVVVGFEDEATTIKETLMGDQKPLQITSIIGMAGLGKTTLAKKVYNDPFIVYHFHVRAWIYVSQTYSKRDLLLGCLKSASLIREADYGMNDGKLSEELCKRLKGRRYLIVIDDLWKTGAWEELRRCFPNDNTKSRILVTSRLADVISNAKPHFLRFLTKDEGWNILQLKLFKNVKMLKKSSNYLVEQGKQILITEKILKKCQGLPLALVVIGGLLAKTSEDQWETVLESVSSLMVSDSEDFMETLALSYNNLSHPLKACFLYVGAFPEDYEIRVRNLICLWISEGFIRQNGQKCMEEVAESYLMDLIDRNLLTVAQRRSDGGVKTCRIHDLVRDLCIRKAREEHFLEKIFSSGSSSLCMRTYLWFSSWSLESFHLATNGNRHGNLYSFTLKPFQLLRVLDLWSIRETDFPVEVGWLVHLRYFAIRTLSKSIPSSISDLWNLETLIIGGSSALALPYNLGKMMKLRHLIIKRQTSIPHVKEPTSYNYPFKLINLQSFSTLLLHGSSEQVLSRIPMIRKLGCIFLESWNGELPKLHILIHLHTLKVVYRRVITWPSRFPTSFKFPSTLRKLTISGFHMLWTEVSTIGKLPNFEVLKLRLNSFMGPVWNANDGEFVQLKFLKLEDLDIEQWNAEASHFPVLQRVAIVRCKRLRYIPSGLGDIFSLEKIEVYSSSISAADSAKQIQEEQQSLGNYVLRVLINQQ